MDLGAVERYHQKENKQNENRSVILEIGHWCQNRRREKTPANHDAPAAMPAMGTRDRLFPGTGTRFDGNSLATRTGMCGKYVAASKRDTGLDIRRALKLRQPEELHLGDIVEWARVGLVRFFHYRG